MTDRKKHILDGAKYTFSILFGNLLLAFSIYALVAPYPIAAGGFTGLGLTVERALDIPAEYFLLPANIIVLVFGCFVLGRKTVVASIASSLLYPVFIAVLRYIPGLDTMTDNALLATVLGAAGVGSAMGILMRVGASTGGADIISLSIHKWFNIPVSTVVLVFDSLVILGQVFISGMEMILYGVLYTVILTMTLNKVLLFGQSKVQVTVISDFYEEIRTSILNELRLGVTMLRIQTGAREEEQMGVLCVIHPRQLHTLQKKILSIDPEAFITVVQIQEVRGQGFTFERREMVPVSGKAGDCGEL